MDFPSIFLNIPLRLNLTLTKYFPVVQSHIPCIYTSLNPIFCSHFSSPTHAILSLFSSSCHCPNTTAFINLSFPFLIKCPIIFKTPLHQSLSYVRHVHSPLSHLSRGFTVPFNPNIPATFILHNPTFPPIYFDLFSHPLTLLHSFPSFSILFFTSNFDPIRFPKTLASPSYSIPNPSTFSSLFLFSHLPITSPTLLTLSSIFPFTPNISSTNNLPLPVYDQTALSHIWPKQSHVSPFHQNPPSSYIPSTKIHLVLAPLPPKST